MYEKFNCPALYVAQAPLLSAYAYGDNPYHIDTVPDMCSGHSSGLVVDVGHSSAQVHTTSHSCCCVYIFELFLVGHSDHRRTISSLRIYMDEFVGFYVIRAMFLKHTHEEFATWVQHLARDDQNKSIRWVEGLSENRAIFQGKHQFRGFCTEFEYRTSSSDRILSRLHAMPAARTSH